MGLFEKSTYVSIDFFIVLKVTSIFFYFINSAKSSSRDCKQSLTVNQAIALKNIKLVKRGILNEIAQFSIEKIIIKPEICTLTS